MYNVNELKKRIEKEGIRAVILYLTSDRITEEEQVALKKEHILFSDNQPCLSLIYSLAAVAE